MKFLTLRLANCGFNQVQFFILKSAVIRRLSRPAESDGGGCGDIGEDTPAAATQLPGAGGRADDVGRDRGSAGVAEGERQSECRPVPTVPHSQVGNRLCSRTVNFLTHQVSNYILLTLIWEFHHVAYMACRFCQICSSPSRIR